MHDVHHISIFIARSPDEVYEFASNPRNLPLWAEGLASAEVNPVGDAWAVEAPFGMARLRFAERNPFGVLDHDVELESGVTVHNPMRVMPNGEGSEFVFSLFRQTGMTDEQFSADRLTVEKDLQRLKALLER